MSSGRGAIQGCICIMLTVMKCPIRLPLISFGDKGQLRQVLHNCKLMRGCMITILRYQLHWL